MGIKAPSSLWHQHLDHPSESVLHHIICNFHLPIIGFIQKDVAYEYCQIGKSIQQPFSSSYRETFGPLDLVHSDVWVAPLASPSGFKFYVTFMDDFSRFTWLYSIANKYDIFNSFVQFRLLLEKNNFHLL